MIHPFDDEYFMKRAPGRGRASFSRRRNPGRGCRCLCHKKHHRQGIQPNETLSDVTSPCGDAGDYLCNQLAWEGKYLTGCTLYVTLGHALMCAGALGWTQIDRSSLGASDPKERIPKIRSPQNPFIQKQKLPGGVT